MFTETVLLKSDGTLEEPFGGYFGSPHLLVPVTPYSAPGQTYAISPYAMTVTQFRYTGKIANVAFVDGQNLFYAVKLAFGYSFPNYDIPRLAQAIGKWKGVKLSAILDAVVHDDGEMRAERHRAADRSRTHTRSRVQEPPAARQVARPKRPS